MTTWQKMLAVLISIIFGGVVGYNCIKPHIENVSATSNNSNTNDVFDQYIYEEANNSNEEDNEQQEKVVPDEEEKGTTLTDEEYKKVEVTGTDEEKAIALAKNAWQADNDSVSFNIAKREGSVFYISINDNRTTQALAWYKVDISNGEVSDY